MPLRPRAWLALLLVLVLLPLSAPVQAQAPYTATAGLLPVGPDPDAPTAEMFYVAYTRDGTDPAVRPVTFLFNGGPGAASVYLHLGAAGPRVLATPGDGRMPQAPAGLEDNPASWLDFTDLVFLDPVGTGYSRALAGGAAGSDRRGNARAFWDVRADLASIGQSMRLYLTRHERWESPKAIAGESYGGLRAAALTRVLAEEHDIVLNAAVLISPALDLGLIDGGTRHALLPWATLLPSLAATAAAHGRGELPDGGLEAVEDYALGPYLAGLGGIGRTAPETTGAFYAQVAALTGLPVEEVARRRGRVGSSDFAKLVLRPEGRVLDVYDGMLAYPDPAPEREELVGGSRSLRQSTALLGGAFPGYLEEATGWESPLRYLVLNNEVRRRWSFASGIDGEQGYVGTADDLAAALSANEGLRVLVAHGRHDLVTPYLASRYLVDQTVADPDARARVAFATYDGGHMFYFHAASRDAFTADVSALFATLGVVN